MWNSATSVLPAPAVWRIALVLGLLAAAPTQVWASPEVRGNPRAPKGGVLRNHYGVSPHLLHPLNTTDLYGNLVLNKIYERLADNDVETFEFIPLLAERWETSSDNLTHTFYINPNARWHDGKTVTAEDVKFSFDVRLHPKLKTRGKWQAFFGNVESAEVLGPHTVRFRVKRDHFLNFVNLASMRIVPKHGFPGDDPNKTPLSKAPLGSGPYRLVKWKKGALVQLKKHEAYWAADLPQNVGRFNAKILLTKIIATDKVALESFKKGDLDVIEFRPQQWARETEDERFSMDAASGKPLIKMAVRNQQPRPCW